MSGSGRAEWVATCDLPGCVLATAHQHGMAGSGESQQEGARVVYTGYQYLGQAGTVVSVSSTGRTARVALDSGRVISARPGSLAPEDHTGR